MSLRPRASAALPIERGAFLVITAGVLVIAATQAAYFGCLWRDEVNGVVTATASSWSDVWRLLEFESAPIVWTIVLRVWHAIAGDSDASWRILGALEGVSVAAAMAFAVWRMTRRPALAGLALVALNPLISRWSATIRPWGAAACAAVIVIAVFWDLIKQPSRLRIAIATIAAVISVQLGYQNAVFLAATIAACVMVAWSRRHLSLAIPQIAIGAVAAASLLPYVGVIRGRMSWVALGQAPVTLAMIGKRVATIAGADRPAGLIAAVLVLILAGLSLFATGRVLGRDPSPVERPRDETRALAIYALSTLMATSAALACFYLVFRYPTQEWYYIGWFAVAATSVDVVLAVQWRGRPQRTALAIIAMLIGVVGFVPSFTGARAPLSNVRLVADRVTALAGPDDLVVVSPWYGGVAFSYYYTGRAPVVSLPPIEDFRVHRYDLVRPRMLSPGLAMPPLLDRMEQVLRAGHRVFVAGREPKLPKSGQLAMLPPPPLERTAWNATPYETLWETQAGAFLAASAGRKDIVPLESYGTNEAYGLWVYTGWK